MNLRPVLRPGGGMTDWSFGYAFAAGFPAAVIAIISLRSNGHAVTVTAIVRILFSAGVLGAAASIVLDFAGRRASPLWPVASNGSRVSVLLVEGILVGTTLASKRIAGVTNLRSILMAPPTPLLARALAASTFLTYGLTKFHYGYRMGGIFQISGLGDFAAALECLPTLCLRSLGTALADAPDHGRHYRGSLRGRHGAGVPASWRCGAVPPGLAGPPAEVRAGTTSG